MDIHKKIEILAKAAKYDVSCSSSGSQRSSKKGAVGNTAYSGICHSWSEDGRCISLLKILMSNDCAYDCSYCVNRCSHDFQRATLTPEELVDITMNFYKRNYIEGLFLSSAVLKNPSHTMEKMLCVIKKLRLENHYNGYIHLKIIPGADERLVEEAGFYADRVSVNLEVPTEKGLKQLAPQKQKGHIFGPMEQIKNKIQIYGQNQVTVGTLQSNFSKSSGVPLAKKSSHLVKGRTFVPAGQTTQMMIGATDDTDYTILRLSEALYRRMALKRVYYSAYVPMNKEKPNLPLSGKPPLLREHRLYQADWLMRFYGFEAGEILNQENPFFDPLLDPKANWAIRNMHLFPVDINRASYHTLLRIPGVGPRSAKRIVASRKFAPLDYNQLKKLGVVLKRAQFFVHCGKQALTATDQNPDIIRKALIGKSILEKEKLSSQVSFMELYPEVFFGGQNGMSLHI